MTASTIASPQRERSNLRQRAQPGEPLDRGRRLHRDVADGLVLEHAAARDVAGLRLALAPGGDLHQDGELLGLAHAGLEPLPGRARAPSGRFSGRGQDFHLLAHPFGAAALVEIGRELDIDVAQMGHVGDRVGELRRGQRAAGPVGEAVRFVERVAGDALHELVVGDRVAIAEHHGGDLGIDQREGMVPASCQQISMSWRAAWNTLTTRSSAISAKNGRQIDLRRQGIDDHSLLGAGHLRDAEYWVIGAFAQELGVDRHEGVLRQACASLCEFVCRRYWLHWIRLIAQAKPFVRLGGCPRAQMPYALPC